MTANPLNAVNRGVYISDNLPFLRSLNNECIDLVCIDPPFGKKQTFEGKLKPPLSADERRIERELMESWGVYDAATAYEAGLEYPDQSGTTAKFRDIWAFERLFEEGWLESLKETFPAAWWLIQATRYSHGEQTAAYIGFMLERLVEIKRVLKDTGSVYLHCDHEANAYLRQLMDAVFGAKNFRNEIHWKRQTSNNAVTKSYGNIIDTILFYVKTDATTWNQQYSERSERELNEYRPDENGRLYKTENLTAPTPAPTRMFTWRGTTPKNGWRYSKQYLEELWAQGRIKADRQGKPLQRGRIQYLDEMAPGQKLQNLWDDIQRVGNTATERTGYPTQKPQALARRIIEASSNPGDVVLDCFAGCAYVPVAAELTGRRWVACDMSPRAWTVVRRQFHKQDSLRIRTEGEITFDEPLQFRLDDERVIAVRGPNKLPERDTPRQANLPARSLPTVKYKQKPLETSLQIWEAFVAQYGPECWYCGRQTRSDRRELHLDHVEPNRRDGTNDDCWNRALACSPCNSDKGSNPDLDKVFEEALASGRISSKAKLNEVRRTFEERREWARARWESIPKQKALVGAAA